MIDRFLKSSGKLVSSVVKEEVCYLQSRDSYLGEVNYIPSVRKGIVRRIRFAMRREVRAGMWVGCDNLLSYDLKPDEVKAIIVGVNHDYALAICPECFFGEFADIKSKIETYSKRGVDKGDAFLPSYEDFLKLYCHGEDIDATLREYFGISLLSYKIDPKNTFSAICNKYWFADDEYSREQENEDSRRAVLLEYNLIHKGLKTEWLRQGEAALGFPFLRFDYADCDWDMHVINPWD